MIYSLITVMAGNTHTKAVGWHDDGLQGEVVAWRTHDAALYHEDLRLSRAAGSTPYAPLEKMADAETRFVLAGVTPAYQDELKRWLEASGYAVLRFRAELPAPIEIIPQPAEKVGDDRIAGALGALARDPLTPAVVIDSGTALTINAVSPGKPDSSPSPSIGKFEGGLIIPGQDLMLAALKQFTQRLPRLDHVPLPATLDAATAIGRNTDEAMTRGAWHAYVYGAISGALAQRQMLGQTARILLTGGGAEELLPHLVKAFEPDANWQLELHAELVHLGLYAAYRAANP